MAFHLKRRGIDVNSVIYAFLTASSSMAIPYARDSVSSLSSRSSFRLGTRWLTFPYVTSPSTTMTVYTSMEGRYLSTSFTGDWCARTDS